MSGLREFVHVPVEAAQVVDEHLPSERYSFLTKHKHRVLDELAATLPHISAFDERIEEMKSYLDANNQIPPYGTKLRNWWRNNYSTTPNYNRLPKGQSKKLDELAAWL